MPVFLLQMCWTRSAGVALHVMTVQMHVCDCRLGTKVAYMRSAERNLQGCGEEDRLLG